MSESQIPVDSSTDVGCTPADAAASITEIDRPKTGTYVVKLECGHTKIVDFSKPTNQEGNIQCRGCSDMEKGQKPRRRPVAILQAITTTKGEDAEAAVEAAFYSAPEVVPVPASLPRVLQATESTNIIGAAASATGKELATLRMQMKNLTDIISSKDATIRQYMSQISKLNDIVTKVTADVEQMKVEQQKLKEETIKDAAEDNARNIENNWRPKLKAAHTLASLSRANLDKELNRSITLTLGDMMTISALLDNGYQVCHVRRRDGKNLNVLPGKPVAMLTEQILGQNAIVEQRQPATSADIEQEAGEEEEEEEETNLASDIEAEAIAAAKLE